MKKIIALLIGLSVSYANAQILGDNTRNVDEEIMQKAMDALRENLKRFLPHSLAAVGMTKRF